MLEMVIFRSGSSHARPFKMMLFLTLTAFVSLMLVNGDNGNNGENVGNGGPVGADKAQGQGRMKLNRPNALPNDKSKRDQPVRAGEGHRPEGFKPQGKFKKRHPSLADSAECGKEVKEFCADKADRNNFVILDCLQNDEKRNDKLSEACQHHLWVYKHNLTLDDKFDRASNEDCAKELEVMEDCSSLPEGKGERIPCLIEHFDEVHSKPCKNFLNKMASIIFSDYRLMSFFMKDCQNDVEFLKCGRLDDAEQDSPHSQGLTVECLSKKRKQLSKVCKKAIFRVAEFQSDDFHLDRPLYYACKGDREALCRNVDAGEGAVFKCLYANLGNKILTENCRTKLEERQELIAEDVKIDKTFYMACKADIKAHKCYDQSGEASEMDLERSKVLLCLESVQNAGKKLHGGCIKQMFELRTELMQDFKISPELVAACADEINNLCDGLEPGGSTIQCLMSEVADKGNKVGSECQAKVAQLLHVANPGEDVTLDMPLQRACQAVLDTTCRDKKHGDGNAITCLLESLDDEEMTDECEEHLLAIQYFAVRDFQLDHHLRKACRKDAMHWCHVPEHEDPWSKSPDSGPQVFACLHRHLRPADDNEKKLSRGCAHEVIRVVRERSRRIDLMPEVEEVCRPDLARFCSDDDEHTEKGAEMDCLQENLDDLVEKCKRVVANFTIEQSEIPELDNILMKSCMPMIKQFCNHILDSDAMPDEILECLIKSKHNVDMHPKCAAGIEHHQLISLKDFRFNHKFRDSCQIAVNKLCANKRTKYDVIACLSEHVRNDTLMDRPHKVDAPCRKQLKVEHLQRDESINLNRDLKQNCRTDIQKFCQNVSPGKGQVMECLKSHKRKLDTVCHDLLFKREQADAVLGDYALLRTCKTMIKNYCSLDAEGPEILDCLKTHKDDIDFEDSCRKIVVRRLIEQAKDVRLNPHLLKSCRLDIPKFCHKELDDKLSDRELEGNVINCLKKHYGSKAKSLSQECGREIASRIKEAALDIKQNPILLKLCKEDIKRSCLKGVKNVERMKIDEEEENEGLFPGNGIIIECLKSNFQTLMEEECKKEVAYMIAESRIDIHVDPLLHSSCQRDLKDLCHHENQGMGRQMSCLLNYLESDPDSITTNCRVMLTRRKELWEYAAKVAPPESFQEIFDQMSTSPSRNYFLAILFTVVGIIFIFGLTCGRVSKRVRAEIKNK